MRDDAARYNEAHAQVFLTREEETVASEEQLILSHGRLVVKMARYYHRKGFAEFDDLVQVGNIGLATAAKKFDRTAGTRFSTYAQWWVKETMNDHCARNRSIVKPTSKMLRGSIMDIQKDESTDKVLHEGLTLGESFVDPSPLPDEIVGRSIDSERIGVAIREALRGLTKRESAIIRSRLLADDKETLDVLGSRLGISKERVRQIEQKTIAKLRKRLQPIAAMHGLA